MKSSYWPIEQLPGLSQKEQAQLKSVGITTTQVLLNQTKTQAQKHALANQLNSSVQLIGKWVALADLARVSTVGCDYCGLILHSGIISVQQLAAANIAQLHRQILKLQVTMLQRSDLCPSLAMVQTWIQEAKALSQSDNR